MKATKEQIDRSIKKLARAVGKTNCPNNGMTASDRWALVFEASWQLIKKTGHRSEYQKAIQKEFKRSRR